MNALCKFAALGVAACTLAASAAGCASNQSDVPIGAKMVAEGNKKLTYQAPHDGTIYVYDDDANRLIYTGDIRRDQTLSIDTKSDDITIEGRRATEWDLDPDHRMQIYFNERPMSEPSSDGQHKDGGSSDYRG